MSTWTNSKKDPCPCTRECERRVPGCHATCEDYIAWNERHRAKLEDIKAMRRREKAYGKPRKRPEF